MDYFILKQDIRILNAIKPLGLSALSGRTPFRTDETLKPDEETVQLYLKEDPFSRYVDFIENPEPLVSDKMKIIFEKYQPRLFFKPVVLAERKRQRQALYWWMIPERVDCLAPESVFKKDGTIERLVIDGRKTSRTKIFQVAGMMERYVIIRLDVAESLLRRDFYGIRLKRVCVA